ncbi:MAG: hypothetical protein FJZ75_06270 [Bacteroidetes bacterium]|nr:hypothetical protein [Bacteroidota bacterium]
MRHLFLLLTVLALPITNKLQGQTLQFSRVLFVTTTQTVPANKVWKVESILYSAAPTNIMGGNQNDQLVIDGNAMTVRATRSSNGGYNAVTYGVWEQKLPLWMPAGSTLAAGQNVNSISVVEFTVVP